MIAALVLRSALFAFVWWMLAEGRTDSWSVGLPSVALATGISLWLAPPGHLRVSLWGALVFAGFFLLESIRGGLQVAAQVFRPRMDIAPGLITVPVTLPEGLGRVLLINTLNLLPGTVSVRLIDNTLWLHVLDTRLPIAHEVDRVEARIAHALTQERLS